MQQVRFHVRLCLTIVILCMIIDRTTSIVWTTCSQANLQAANAQCGFLSVPLNYKRRRGEQLRIAMARILHTSSQAEYKGVMLVKIGGVVAPGLGTVLLRQSFPTDVAATYDWISFDSRGGHLTGPNMSCIPDFFPAPPLSQVPTTDELEKHWLNRSETYVQACRKKHGSVIPHINSLNRVRDIEQIRRAIGASRLHMYTNSYGSYLAQMYATLYPNKVGRLVMDTLWDPDRVWYDRTLDLNKGTERLLNIWLEWVAKYDSIYHLGNRSCEVREQWNSALKRVAENPIDGWIGPWEWNDLLVNLFSGAKYWTDLTPILAAYMKDNNGTGAAEISIRTTDENEATELIITCNDRRWPKSWAEVKTDYWRSYAEAPLYTWSNGWYKIPCIFWPFRNSEIVNVNGSRIGDVLLVFETNTIGYREENVMNVRRNFPHARFISVVNGTAPSNALSGSNSCVHDIIIAYVRNGTVPARLAGDVADVECASPPLPTP